MFQSRKTRNIFFGIVLLLVVGASVSFYFYKKLNTTKESEVVNKSEEVVIDETADIVAKVGRLMFLPNEEASLATILHPENLQDQPFFVNAKKGDKVLIFSISKKAILYDPVADKIIDIGPIILADPPATSTNQAL